MSESPLDYATEVASASGWVDLGAIARRHLTEALLSAPALRAMLAAVAETGGAPFPEGAALVVELEVTGARVRLAPEGT